MDLHSSSTKSRFFSLLDLPPSRFRLDALESLGKAMAAESFGWPNEHIPSGYVYLGQFIVHDITRLARGDDPPQGRPLDLNTLRQLRTPALDLDCIYGKGFDDPLVAVDKETGNMFLGRTMRSGNWESSDNDLPRTSKGKARIGDSRNDENFLVAQMHLQFLKLHNHFADLVGGHSAEDRFDNARRELTLRYQQVVLFDFLEKILDQAVWTYVIDNNQPVLWPVLGVEAPEMPIELAGAALRFGHSMVQQFYFVNTRGEGGSAEDITLDKMFKMTGSREINSEMGVPENKVVDWAHFFELDPAAGRPLKFNLARQFLPWITLGRNEPGEIVPNLGTHNLLRGNELGLPDAQSVIARLEAHNPRICEVLGIRLLRPEELDIRAPKAVAGVLSSFPQGMRLAEKTPLWYYILAEAYVIGGRKTLGPLGSLIVADSFRTLTALSSPSIIAAPSAEQPNGYYLQRGGQMRDLLSSLQ